MSGIVITNFTPITHLASSAAAVISEPDTDQAPIERDLTKYFNTWIQERGNQKELERHEWSQLDKIPEKPAFGFWGGCLAVSLIVIIATTAFVVIGALPLIMIYAATGSIIATGAIILPVPAAVVAFFVRNHRNDVYNWENTNKRLEELKRQSTVLHQQSAADLEPLRFLEGRIVEIRDELARRREKLMEMKERISSSAQGTEVISTDVDKELKDIKDTEAVLQDLENAFIAARPAEGSQG